MADYNSKYTGTEIDSAVGKVLNNEVGGMILIPSAVLNLTPASSSSDILSAFGGEEVFKSICQNVLNGITPYIGSVNEQQRQVDVIFTNFFTIIKDNSYTLSFSQLSYVGSNYNYDFRLQGGTVTFTKTLIAYGFINSVTVSDQILLINTNSRQEDILTAFGLDLNQLKEVAYRLSLKDCVVIMKGEDSPNTICSSTAITYRSIDDWSFDLIFTHTLPNETILCSYNKITITCNGNQVSCTGRNSYTLNKIEETDCRKEISAPSDSFYDIIICDFKDSETSCSGLVTLVSRNTVNNASFLTFYFIATQNFLEIKVLQNSDPNIFKQVRYTNDNDFGYLSIRLNSSTTKWEGKIALNTNCSLLPEGKFLTESQILTNNVEVNL
jgi:hypothetical protein